MLTTAIPAARPRGRPTAGAAQAREQDVLRVAGDLFERHGFAGVTMAEVARRASISKTTLYARYANKAALFRAICSYSCRVPADRIAAVEITGREPAVVLADFAAAVVSATGDEAADRFLRLAIFEAPRFPALAEEILHQSRAVSAPIAGYFAGLAQAGRLPGRDPVLLADQFVALVTGGYVALLESAPGSQGAARIGAALALVLPAIDPAD